MIVVREGREEDVDAVVALWDNLTKEDAPPETDRWDLVGDALELWRGHLTDRFIGGEGALFVAEETDAREIVGFVTAEPRPVSRLFPTGVVGRIDAIYVVASWQGKGVGRRLVAAAEDWFVKQGVQTVEVKTFWGNVASRAMWAHLGYREVVVTLEKAISAPERGRSRTATSEAA